MKTIELQWTTPCTFRDFEQLYASKRAPFDFTGVYLHLLRLNGKIGIINVGTATSKKRDSTRTINQRQQEYWKGYHSRSEYKWNTFDLSLIGKAGLSVNDLICNGRLYDSLQSKLILHEGFCPSSSVPDRFGILREEFIESLCLFITAASVNGDRREDSLVAESAIIKHFVKNHKYDCYKYRGRANTILGRLERKPPTNVAVKNIFPRDSSDFFALLPTSIMDTIDGSELLKNPQIRNIDEFFG